MNLRVDQNFKIDHYLRPIIIIKINDRVENIKEVDQKKYEIILERFHSNAKEAEDMLIEIAEPSSITQNIQTFTITFYSLYTAMTLGWNEHKIIQSLDKLSKNEQVPQDIVDFIHAHTKYFNKASFYLQNGEYFIDIENSLFEELKQRGAHFIKYLQQEDTKIYNLPNQDDDEENDVQSLTQMRKKFSIKGNDHFKVNQELVERFNVPVQQEYDFHNDEKGIHNSLILTTHQTTQ